MCSHPSVTKIGRMQIDPMLHVDSYKTRSFSHFCGLIRRWFVFTFIIVYLLAFNEELGDVVEKETSGQFQELLLKILKV